nr:ubiquitin-conjugating enzyme E2 Z-like [Dermacentor andersoni]
MQRRPVTAAVARTSTSDETARLAAAFGFELASSQTEQPSTQCLLRLSRDLAHIFDDPPPGVFVEPEENDITNVHAVIVGPDDTPYEGGFFHFVLKCLPDYPARPPLVRLMTTDAGRVRFNPNLYSSGLVSLSILGTFPGPSWCADMTLETVLVSIQSLLSVDPLANEPGLGHAFGSWLEKVTGYNATLRYQTLRVAVCDALEACLLGNSSYPRVLQQAVLKHFVERYAKYENAVRVQLGTDPSALCAGLNGAHRYEALLKRLQDLYDRVLRSEAICTQTKM